MKYWVFNEQQLEAALRNYVEHRGGTDEPTAAYCAQHINDFLCSQEARDQKMRGDYER